MKTNWQASFHTCRNYRQKEVHLQQQDWLPPSQHEFGHLSLQMSTIVKSFEAQLNCEVKTTCKNRSTYRIQKQGRKRKN